MKKILTALLVFFVALQADAQFQQGTKYVGASLSNLGMSYSKKSEFRFGVNADAGYFFVDNWMLHADVGYEHTKATDDFFAGASLRYYIKQNGLYLSAGAEYAHKTKSDNDLYVPVEIGYTFYLNNKVAIEPAVYYKMSTNDFADGSTVGLRLGLGYYF